MPEESHSPPCPYVDNALRELDDTKQVFSEWQARQNGSIQRTESKIDRLYFMIISGFGSLFVALLVLAVTVYVQIGG